jgi:hypothetical protein
MTTHGLQRLLADLAGLAEDHPIDAGVLGEYALVGRQHGPDPAPEWYPRVAAHLRAGCERCKSDLATLDALARRSGPPRGEAPRSSVPAHPSDETPAEPPTPPDAPAVPEPLEVAEATALARAIEAEREAVRAPLRPDRAGQVDSRRRSTRRRQLLLVEAALVRQRLLARRLFLDRALAAFRQPAAGRPIHQNPKAGLLLDDFAGQLDDLRRLTGRLARLTADLRRLGDDPRGPTRPQSEALTERGLSMTRDALAIDRRLARLQGPLAGMV